LGDPSSQVISEKEAFQPIAALLKAWSVPFDFLRLDQQTRGVTYLFDRSAGVRYGAIPWLADVPSYAGKNLEVLTEAVEQGTSPIVAASRFRGAALSRYWASTIRQSIALPIPFFAG
jgi:hypothetical protein